MSTRILSTTPLVGRSLQDLGQRFPDLALNAVLLPHLGSATRETREAMARLLCEGIGTVLAC